MADHRKFFRPRRLAFGGRLLPCAWLLALLLALFSVAHAEDAGLKNGAASLAAGKYDNAVRQLSATINADGVAPGEAAKALYLRGIAYRKLGQPSRAIADLGAAIWLGLPEGDRVKALVNRGIAFQSAGLAKEGEADIALARKSGGGEVDQLIAEGGGSTEGAAAIAAFSTSVTPESQGYGSNAQAPAAPAAETPARTANASGQWTTTASADTGESASSGNRVSRWWGSVTGSSSPEQPAASTPGESTAPTPAPSKPPSAPGTGWGAQTQQTASATVPPSAPPATSSQPRAPSTGWGAQTQGGDTVVASDASPSQSRWSRWFSKSAEAEAPAAPAAAPTVGSGGFRLQLATSRSEQEAKDLWKKVSSENQAVAGAQPEIEKVDIGNFGTFYSLKIGPFPDKAESLKVCNALKRNGVDCSLAEAQ